MRSQRSNSCSGFLRKLKDLETQEDPMKAQVALAALLLLSTVVLTTGPVLAHSGGLDGYGCHHDRKHGGYHCHRGPLAGHAFESQQEMLVALEALNQEPNAHPEWVPPPDPSKKDPETYKIVPASF